MTTVAVAAPHGDAVDAARQAVAAGGNALDAALAAAAVLAVVYPHQCSLGGDLSALVRRPSGDVEVVLSLGAAPAAIDVEGLRDAGGGMPRQGGDSVTVPGVVAGWQSIAGLGARLGLADPLARAARIAEAGVAVAPGLRRAIEARLTTVRDDPGLRAVMTDGDRPARWLRQPALAATLTELAGDPGGFYDGDLAVRLAAGLASLGSAITAGDLAAHRVDRPAPLTLRAAGGCWWAAPPPAQGATALAMLDTALGGDLLERARAAHAARADLLGDPRGGPIDVDGLARPRRSAASAATAAARMAGDTVAICAVDDEGRSVSLIQSVFQTFGAGLLEPGTGIVLHNRAGAFTLLKDPRAHAAHPARLAPGLRPPHTLCPLLAERDGTRVALGCQGGRAQPLILAQVGPPALEAARSLASILAAPRWVVGDRDLDFDRETLLAEPGAGLPSVPDQIDLVYAADRDDRCGHAQIARAAGASLEAAADPRADGGALLTGACGTLGTAP